jgi:hypothetical protein
MSNEKRHLGISRRNGPFLVAFPGAIGNAVRKSNAQACLQFRTHPVVCTWFAAKYFVTGAAAQLCLLCLSHISGFRMDRFQNTVLLRLSFSFEIWENESIKHVHAMPVNG